MLLNKRAKIFNKCFKNILVLILFFEEFYVKVVDVKGKNVMHEVLNPSLKLTFKTFIKKSLEKLKLLSLLILNLYQLRNILEN